MNFKDGQKRQGRFIKSGSKVLEKVALQEFNFTDLNEAPVIEHDNATNSIIHTKYHASQEISSAVKDPDKFNDELIDRSHNRSIIYPMDFTESWERERKLKKDKSIRQDDDDFDFNMELNQELAQQGKEQPATAATVEAPAKSSPSSVKPAADRDAVAPAPDLSAGGFQFKREEPSPTDLRSMDSPRAQTVTEFSAAFQDFKNSAGYIGSETQGNPVAKKPTAPAATFIAADTTPAEGIKDPEAEASDSYRQQVQVRAQLAEQEREQLIAEARKIGYEAGFREGEEKGELQVRHKAAQMTAILNELIHEFTNLKTEILSNVQENFYTLCQAMAEALLRREFSINPDAFVTVMRRAIQEAVEPGKFRIRVNPETAAVLAGSSDKELLASIIKDAEIPAGDFRVETEMSVVDVTVTKLISDLLQETNIDLFSAEDKAG